MNKSGGPNGVRYKILNLLKKDTSKQLVNLFDISLSSSVFPSSLKIAKVVPVYKKDSKLDCRNFRRNNCCNDCCNFRPISLLSNIEEKLEKLMQKRD